MRLIRNICDDSFFNMAVEEYFLTVATEPLVVLWRNARTVVIGRNQNALQEVNLDFARQNNIDVVRRLSGGGAVFHDKGNINFTVIQKHEAGLFHNYEHFTAPICEYLRSLGVNAVFAGRNDLLIEGKKFSGNAQAVKNHNIMHHGTIMFNADISELVGVLNPNQLKINSKSIKSVQARVTNVAEHLLMPMEVQEFYTGLLAMFAKCGYELTELSAQERQEIARLAETKYRTWDWNFGQAPAYTLTREQLFDFGIVELRLEITKGRIVGVKIYGDFFGLQDVGNLEHALIGAQYNQQAVIAALSTLNVADYIKGMTAKQFALLVVD